MKRYKPIIIQRLQDQLNASAIQIKTKIILLNEKQVQVLLARADHLLLGYKYDPATKLWQYLWKKGLFFAGTDDLRNEPWLINEDGFVVARTATGLHVFKWNQNMELEHLATDGRYHEAYGWSQPDHTLLLGNFFHDSSLIGIMSRNERGEIRFETVRKEEALKRSQLPIWKIASDPEVPLTWKNLQTDISLAYVDLTEQHAIVVRSETEISVFKFDESQMIRNIIATRMTYSRQEGDKVVFGRFMEEDNFGSNMLQFNATGMTAYRYTPTSKDLQRILYASQFAGKLGWTNAHFDSVVLEDFDGDELDEMLYCAPSGFNIMKLSKDMFGHMIVSENDIDAQHRHVKAFVSPILSKAEKHIVTASENGIIVFQLKLHTEDLSVESDPSEHDILHDTTDKPHSLIAEPMEYLSVLNVHDQLDFPEFIHPRNSLLGILDFSVPLIEIPNAFGIPISQAIKYKEYRSPDVLGYGWLLPLHCIYIDRRGSIFPIAHNYYLVKDGLQSQLHPKVGNASTSTLSFTLNGSPEMEIKYENNQNMWTVITKEEKFYYGSVQSVDCIQWEPGSEEWPIADNTTVVVKAKPFAWFLAKREDLHGNALKYIYEPEYAHLPTGHLYIEKLFLSKIISTNGDSIKFSYSTLNDRKILKSYLVRTNSYIQNVHFEYNVKDGISYISSISQSGVPILQFKYEGPKREMTEISYPNGLISKFAYQSHKFHSAIAENRFESLSKLQISYGPSYMLIGDKTEHGQIRIKARDVVGSATTQMSSLVFPFLGKEPVVSFTMFTSEQFFAVVLTHTSHKEVCLFRQTPNGWSAVASYLRLDQNSELQIVKSFILVRSRKQLAVLQDVGERWEVKAVSNSVNEDDIIRAFSYGYVLYRDTKLEIGFQSDDGTWITNQLPIASNLIKSSLVVFDQFNADQKTIKDLKHMFMEGVLNTYHNAIVIRSLSLDRNKIYLRLHCKIFNRSYELINDETIIVLVEDLNEHALELPPINENYFKIGYKLKRTKFELFGKHHTGKIIDEINRIKENIEKEIQNHPHATEREKNQFRKKSHDELLDDLNGIYRNITMAIPFAIDPAKFVVQVNNDYVLAASHKFRFNGSRWSIEKVPQSEINLAEFRLDMGNSFQLIKSGRNETIKLHDTSLNDKMVWDTNTPNGNDIFLDYSAFVGVQKNTSAEVFTFHNRKIHRLPKGEILSRLSNHLAIITMTEDHKTAIIRSMKSFTNYRQSVITMHQFIHSQNDIRTTVYEYDAENVIPFSNGFAFSKSKTIPAGKSQLYGWYEDNFNLMDMRNSSKTVHNSQGIIVKTIQVEENDQPRSLNSDVVLTDRLKRFAIVDFRPFRISQEVVSYYGFEPYESNIIGTNKHWIFDTTMITKYRSKHFLRLKPGLSIKGNFKPQINGLSYVFSCWIRTNQAPVELKFINLIIIDKNGKHINIVTSAVYHHIDEWKYVEVSFKNVAEIEEVELNVEISNPSASYVDVDHLRLTPLDFNFQANLLDQRNGIVKAVLRNSGLVEQKLYDPYQHEIGQVSEQGTIELFIAASKNNALHKNGRLISRVEMRPLRSEIVRNHNVQRCTKFGKISFSFRFLYNLRGVGKITASFRGMSVVISRDATHTKLYVNSLMPKVIDSEGEISVLFLPTRIAVWVQGHLIAENHIENHSQSDKSMLEVESAGQCLISEILCMHDPSIKVFYLNKLGIVIQEIVLKNQDTINIRQILYDAIDRPVLKTKWISLQPGENSFFNYNSEVVTNPNAVIAGQKVEGFANDMNPDCQGYPVTWTSYRNDPLQAKLATGLPGKDFSIMGQFSNKFGANHNISTLHVLYPSKMGYRHEYEQNSNASLTVTVFDKTDNKIAELINVVNHDHRLATFEYDKKKRLLCTLPPAYHHKIKTLSRTEPFENIVLTSEEMILKSKWGKHYKYDKKGHLIAKISPDSGKQKLIYSEEGLLRFLVQEDKTSTISTIFYTYGNDGKIIARGVVNIPRSDISDYIPNNTTLPISENFITFDYGGMDVNPSHRNLMQMSRKVSNNVTVTEALIFNSNKQIINQIFVSSNNSLSFNYKYQNGKIVEIEYPFFVNSKQFKLSYDYHIDKHIKSVRSNNRIFANMEYNSIGKIHKINFEPQSSFSYDRFYSYNEPGYLSKIRDAFLTELVDYISNAYGGQSFGDGTVSSTTFNATWHEYSDVSQIKFMWQSLSSNETTNQYARLCFKALKRLNYFDEWNRPTKSFYPMSELQSPLICNTGSRAYYIASRITTKGFPKIYGHRYDYENHKQLIKAKYFQNLDESKLNPLTQFTFSKQIQGISETSSQNIWNTLKSAGFIITDCTNSKVCHAIQGKSLVHPAITNHINAVSLEKLFMSGIKSRKDIPQQIFKAICEVWHEHDPINRKEFCATTWDEMLSNDFIGNKSKSCRKALNPELRKILKNYSRYLEDIVGVLYDHFTYALGNNAGDVQSYDIDPNGNHVHFYTGFKRYRLEYEENTNKIARVFATDLASDDLTEIEFSMEHDSEGNVIKALHKSISDIVYDPLLKRATKITMTDGRKLFFQYDVRGERLFKQVRDPTGNITREKYYMRDVTGKCLVDYELIYLQSDRKPHVRSTAYIRAGEVLIGFIRNDQFYSVFTDHEGSVRLVVKNGEVVAAYDYLPYGQLLRQFHSDSEGFVTTYLYTGQEWDEETGLYNFHARLYDPEIGRFFQVDPKEQYPSPYVYAGNSPISLVDPDGQFAFIAAIAFAAIGAYLGASAANKSFNPLKWKLETALFGGISGAIAGGMAIGAIGASFTFLTTTLGLSATAAGGIMASTSLGFAFLSGASANENWNPIEWNWSSPTTWNSLVTGGLTGATLFGGIGKVHEKFISLIGFTEKLSFVGIVTVSTVHVGFFSGSSVNDWNANIFEWDWNNPSTIWRLTLGANFGMSISPDLKKIQDEIADNVKNFKMLISKEGNLRDIISKTVIQFQESTQLYFSIKETLKVLSTQISKPQNTGPAHVIANIEKGSLSETISTIKSVLFEYSKLGGLNNVSEYLDGIQRLDNREGLRRRRHVVYLNLQVHVHDNHVNHSYLLKSEAVFHTSILNNIFHNIFIHFKSWIGSTQFQKQPTELGSRKNLIKIPKIFTLNNCYRFVMPDELAFVRCYSLYSRYDIFPKLSNQLATEESYSHCFPIEYDSQSAVVCYGVHSNLLFTPKLSINFLDVFNGWLMLALVAPNALKRIKNYGLELFNTSKVETGRPNAEQKDILQRKLHHIKKQISLLTTHQFDLKWLTHIWEDLVDDIEISDSGTLCFYELTDRMDALEDEILEVSCMIHSCGEKLIFKTPSCTAWKSKIEETITDTTELSLNRSSVHSISNKSTFFEIKF